MSDADIYLNEWMLDWSSLRKPACYCHGGLDRNIPAGLVKNQLAGIPGARLQADETEGYFSLSGRNLSELQCLKGLFVKPTGGADSVVVLKPGQSRPGSASERSVDASTIVAEFPEPQLSQSLDAHRPAITATSITLPAPIAMTAVGIILVVVIIDVSTVVLVATFIPRLLAGTEEEFERSCIGNACRSDKKRAQGADWNVLHDGGKTPVTWIPFK